MKPILEKAHAVACIVFLAACSSASKGVRVTKDGRSATPVAKGVQIRDLSSPEIEPVVIGKTFKYTRTSSSGFVTYKADGTFSFQDDQKGTGTGKWAANGTQYCETYGTGPQECGVFKYTGNAYFAAKSRLVEMKIW